jgi:hypothetical protein
MRIHKFEVVSSPFNEKGIWWYKTLYGRFVKVKTSKTIYLFALYSNKKISANTVEDTSDTLVFDTDDDGNLVISFD